MRAESAAGETPVAQHVDNYVSADRPPPNHRIPVRAASTTFTNAKPPGRDSLTHETPWAVAVMMRTSTAPRAEDSKIACCTKPPGSWQYWCACPQPPGLKTAHHSLN